MYVLFHIIIIQCSIVLTCNIILSSVLIYFCNIWYTRFSIYSNEIKNPQEIEIMNIKFKFCLFSYFFH